MAKGCHNTLKIKHVTIRIRINMSLSKFLPKESLLHGFVVSSSYHTKQMASFSWDEDLIDSQVVLGHISPPNPLAY